MKKAYPGAQVFFLIFIVFNVFTGVKIFVPGTHCFKYIVTEVYVLVFCRFMWFPKPNLQQFSSTHWGRRRGENEHNILRMEIFGDGQDTSQ